MKFVAILVNYENVLTTRYFINARFLERKILNS